MLQVSYGHEQLDISRPGEIHWSWYRSPSQNFQSFHFVCSDMDTFQRNFLFLFPHPPEGQLCPLCGRLDGTVIILTSGTAL